MPQKTNICQTHNNLLYIIPSLPDGFSVSQNFADREAKHKLQFNKKKSKYCLKYRTHRTKFGWTLHSNTDKIYIYRSCFTFHRIDISLHPDQWKSSRRLMRSTLLTPISPTVSIFLLKIFACNTPDWLLVLPHPFPDRVMLYKGFQGAPTRSNSDAYTCFMDKKKKYSWSACVP